MVEGLIILVMLGVSVFALTKSLKKKASGGCGCGDCQCGGR